MTEKLFMSIKSNNGTQFDLPTPIDTIEESIQLAKELKAKELTIFKKVTVQKFSERDLYGVVNS